MKRCIYGLNDAPRAWYEKVRKTLMSLGATVSSYDNCLFTWYDNDQLIGILVSHVDDFAFGGTAQFFDTVVSGLRSTLKVGTHETNSFQYLGLTVEQSLSGITLCQKDYIKSIQSVVLADMRASSDGAALNQDEILDLKRLAGQMNWVVTQTRPDVSFEVCAMSNTGKAPQIKLIKQANRALRKMKNNDLTLHFPSIDLNGHFDIVVYSDATYASLNDGASQGAHIVFVKDGSNHVCPIAWQSKKLNRVTKSPLASECSAVNEGAGA